MRPPRPLLALAVLGLALTSCAHKSDEQLKKSFVTVFSTAQLINFYEPWKPGSQAQYQECGVVLKGNRILTTAQMANKSTYLEVQRFGETKRFTAKVDKIGYDMDLALLTVDDPSFFKDAEPADFGDVPLPGDKIKVYGGGDEVSIKEDTVSGLKILWSTEALRNVPALVVNTEIAANSYGCPVFKNGKLVGIPIDTSNKPDKTGSLMPINMIERFLKGVEGGKPYEGFPDLGIFTENLENATLRETTKMGKDRTGHLITKIAYDGSADGILQPGDVLLAIDGHKVDNEGYIKLKKGGRIEYDYLDAFYMMGEKCPLSILRDGKEMKVELPMKGIHYTLPYGSDERNPRYFIFAGLVFSPLTLNYCQMGKWEDLRSRLKEFWFYGRETRDQKEPVLLTHVLPNDINAGYNGILDLLVAKVNDRPIHGMKDLIEAFRHPLGRYHKIELDDYAYYGSTVVLDARKAEKATTAILAQFQIPSDRSTDLK